MAGAIKPKTRPAKRKKTVGSRGAAETVEVRLAAAVKANLGKVQTLAKFLSTAGELTRADRLTIVDQALIMIDQTYVHLPLKRAMHAIDPVQRLRLLKQRLDSYSERAFHNEMISIFVHLRDLHTNYVLPEPLRSRTAFLPFHIEEYFEPVPHNVAPVRRYVVTEVAGGLSDLDFKPGIIVTHWNGIPIDVAVELNAEREAGSNLDARHLQGLQSMTIRWMAMALPPDEEWVVVRYLSNNGKGPAREARFEWQVFIPPAAPGQAEGRSVLGANPSAAASPHARRIGIDAKGEMQRRIRKLLFAPEAVAVQRKMADLGELALATAHAFDIQVMAAGARARAIAPVLGATRRARTAAAVRNAGGRRKASTEASALAAGAMLKGVDLSANSIMPDVIKQFGTVASPNGTFGYVRIVTFDIPGAQIDEFIGEFIRIVALLPQDGLIVDVRGNGGGYVAAGEGLLQTLTPVTIEPERFHLINTPLTLQLCANNASLQAWEESVKEATETGATFSRGFPLTPPGFCNRIGQVYQGPVVLVIDAGCYSTTDMFAAGFQDHGIGTILGSSGHTGAGGANVWEHAAHLQNALPPAISPFKPLPGGASFRVAIRRSTRIGSRSDQLVEDIGVVPEKFHRMTRNDVLNGNADLIAHACEILAGMPRQRLAASCARRADGSLDVTVTTSNVRRVDVLLNGRPVHTLDVNDGSTSFNVASPSPPAAPANATRVLACQGFRNAQLVASTRVQI